MIKNIVVMVNRTQELTHDFYSFAKVVAEEKVTLCEIAGGNPKTYCKMLQNAGVKLRLNNEKIKKLINYR